MDEINNDIAHQPHGVHDSKYDDIERELLNSKAQLRQVIDLIPEFIYARDYDGKFLLVNELAAKQMNCKPEELEGRYYADIDINNDVKDQHLLEDRAVIDSDTPLDIPLEKFTFSDNTIKYVSTKKVPFEMGSSTHKKGVLCVSHDITGFIRADFLKDEYIQQLEELTFTTSHIVRQPLTSMLGLINLIEDDSITKEELKHVLDSFRVQIHRLDSFTKELNNTIDYFRKKITAHPIAEKNNSTAGAR